MSISAWTKGIWIFATFINALSMIWFLLGSTANFNRSLDLVGTVILVLVWIPSLLLVLLSTMFLKNGWVPTNTEATVTMYIIVTALLFLPIFMFQGVTTKGWLYENTMSDSLKITSDQNYEYRIDLINLFQRNSHGRLYVRNLSTGEEKQISVDIQTKKIVVIGEDSKYNEWVLMEPTKTPHVYHLFTTKDLLIPQENFEVDVEAGTSKRLQ